MTDGPARRSRPIYRGRIVDLSVETVPLPNGRTVDLELVRHRGAAAAVPVTAGGDVLLVRQYRFATGGELLEVPAGKLDRPDEPPEECARREVEEETGHRPGRLASLGWLWTTPGFTDERIWLYLALDLAETRQDLQDDEVLTVVRMPLARAVEMAGEGEIVDAKTAVALLRAGRALL